MPSSEGSNEQNSPIPAENTISSAPWRKRRIFAGILTVYIGYMSAMALVLADSIRRSYGFLAGVMSGLGSPGMGLTIPLPAIIIFFVFMIGGLMFCGKKGRGRFVVWIAAFVGVLVVLWSMYLITIVPGMSSPDTSLTPLFINLAISIYLVWVLWKTSQSRGSLRDRINNLFTPKKVGVATLVVGVFVTLLYADEIIYEYNKKYWEPSSQLSRLRIGMSKEQFNIIKGKFYGCNTDDLLDLDVCSWHFRTNKRPDLLVYLDGDKIAKIRTISPRVTGDTVPFDTIDQMQEILGQEDIRSEGYIYTYTKWNISYAWRGNVLIEIALGADDWYHNGNDTGYSVKGRQVCPSQACPWDDEGNLKPEYENATYRDFLSPTPELEKMLTEAKEFE